MEPPGYTSGKPPKPSSRRYTNRRRNGAARLYERKGLPLVGASEQVRCDRMRAVTGGRSEVEVLKLSRSVEMVCGLGTSAGWDTTRHESARCSDDRRPVRWQRGRYSHELDRCAARPIGFAEVDEHHTVGTVVEYLAQR